MASDQNMRPSASPSRGAPAGVTPRAAIGAIAAGAAPEAYIAAAPVAATYSAAEQRHYIKDLLEAIPTPIVAKDIEGRVQQCNSAFARLTGKAREEILGRTVRETGIHMVEFSEVLDREVIETGEVRQQEVWVPEQHGAARVLLTRSPLRLPDGTVRGTITTAIDITKRYMAEQALRQSEERARTLFESAGDSIFISDLDGCLIDVNPVAAETLGYTREEMLSMSISDISPATDAWTSGRGVETVLRKGHLSFEATCGRRDGTTLPVEVSLTPVELEGREVLLAIARDVSERKRAEAERSLLESQLRQAQKMEGIGRLASGIAHDFNNLLTAIGGFAGLAMAGLPEDDERRRDIDQIQQATDRAARLVHQLLEFSRVNRVEPKVVAPCEVVARLERMLEPMVGEDIVLAVDTAGCRRNVLADGGQIEQVIVNLVVNARDAMPNGGRLDIRAVDVDVDDELAAAVGGKAGANVLIEVADTGTGMDAATMERLFEPFFTTKGPGEGTGLGLATVYGIVRNWGGGLHVRSQLGKGSTFGVYLPCVDQAAEAPGTDDDPPTDPAVARGRKILVVEDDDVVRRFAVRVLEGAGYDVAAPETAPEAVGLGLDARPDLLLTDVVMPTMRGSEVAARLRAAYQEMSVLFMSGYGDNGLDESGPTSYLPKPFSADELLRAIKRAMPDGRSR